MGSTAYRYPNERLVLSATLLLVFLVIAVTATATVCLSLVFIIAYILLSVQFSRSHHQSLMRSAYPVSSQRQPEFSRVIRETVERLRPGGVQVYVVPSRQMNAYTFGLSSPKVVVFYSALLDVMDEDEITFILGHELGHVALGHTVLNSMVGGVAGIPASWGAGILLSLSFLWWNRMCEFSADRAGLLACGKPEKAVSALLKLVAGPQTASQAALEAAYQQIDAQDDTFLGSLGELLGSHPMLIRRIQELRSYARSAQYQRLSVKMAL